ncbi:Na+/solute symporter [Thermodesulfobium narugense DSM 14796]|uniref:Na+/solute symporter n=1 Tax=Thermodesulfobium narugense DSM 14796 TaxID=747365 RepID=M1E8M3_9BACT|nr:cation acetate symporter [Thermodesulfobium narugense]AEE15243.1 Na+/solute symporter [Thermodesulfobium narugense DSM 14796]
MQNKFNAFQNALALFGDYVGAASFLGIAGLTATKGFDGLFYAVGWIVGWPIMLFLVAEPMSRRGVSTYIDLIALRFNGRDVKVALSLTGLLCIIIFLVAELIGAAWLLSLVTGMGYNLSLFMVTFIAVCFVLMGGMFGTTWFQIYKTVILFSLTLIILFLTLFKMNTSNFFLTSGLLNSLFLPQTIFRYPFDYFSLSFALLFGTAGLPNILIRFFTVQDRRSARISVFLATLLISIFYLIVFFLGVESRSILDKKDLNDGANMVLLHLTYYIGHDLLFYITTMITFVTIFAVLSGLFVAGATTLKEDVFNSKKSYVWVFCVIAIGIIAFLLAMVFIGQNVAFMVGLSYSLAASANFPVLFCSIYLDNISKNALILGSLVGATLAIILTILGPTVWVDIFHYKAPIYPFIDSTLISMPISFITIIFFSRFYK